MWLRVSTQLGNPLHQSQVNRTARPLHCQVCQRQHAQQTLECDQLSWITLWGHQETWRKEHKGVWAQLTGDNPWCLRVQEGVSSSLGESGHGQCRLAVEVEHDVEKQGEIVIE